MKRAIALTTLILLTGCASGFNSKIISALHETTDKADSARREALFYKLYPGDAAKDKAIAFCDAIKAGSSQDNILDQESEKSRSLVAAGKITTEESIDYFIINMVIVLEAKKNCK